MVMNHYSYIYIYIDRERERERERGGWDEFHLELNILKLGYLSNNKMQVTYVLIPTNLIPIKIGPSRNQLKR
jgi:hypothetical protein